MERKYYIDNLRWMAILLLFPFHAFQIWNGGEYFYIWSHTENVMYALSTFIYPWYMTLLFAIAGISCKYSLQKRTQKQFLCERIKKLLIPFVFGVLFIVPIMTYIAEIFFNGYTGSYIGQYILFFTKETDLTGYKGGFTPAHLWFLLYLFVISLIALLIRNLQKKFFSDFKVNKLPYIVILLLFIPIWAFSYLLDIGGKSIGQFLILFLIGYYCLSEENIMHTLKKYKYISTVLWIVSGCAYTYLYCFAEMRNVFVAGLYNFFGWTGIISLLGIGESYLNFSNKIFAYFTRASFPIYIIHMPVLVVAGFFILKLNIGIAFQFALIVSVSFVLTILIYEIIKRIPYLRFMFGISSKKGVR